MLKIESNKGFPPSCIGELSRLWLSCLGPLVLSLRSFSIIWLSDLSILNVHSESYSRKASFILNMTFTCLWRHAVVCHVIKVIKKDSCIFNSLSYIVHIVYISFVLRMWYLFYLFLLLLSDRTDSTVLSCHKHHA
jgi:hypothetical protein